MSERTEENNLEVGKIEGTRKYQRRKGKEKRVQGIKRTRERKERGGEDRGGKEIHVGVRGRVD